MNVSSVLTSIQLLMTEPNPDDPLMTDIVSKLKALWHFQYIILPSKETYGRFLEKHIFVFWILISQS